MKNLSRDIITLNMCTLNDNHIMYGSWDMECDRQNFLSFWTVFSLLPPKQPKKSNFWKKKDKKLPGDIIILHMCTLNDNHMMYGYWDIERDRQNILPFCTIFCPFTPLAAQKMKILKKWKNYPGDIINLHKCTINDNCMMYGSWDMKCDGQNVLSFPTIFCPEN